MEPIVLAPLLLLLFMGSSSSSKRRAKTCVPRIFVLDPTAIQGAVAASVSSGARTVNAVTSEVLAIVYPTYPGLSTAVTWPNPNADKAVTAELRTDAVCLKKALRVLVIDLLKQAGIPPFPACPAGAVLNGATGRCEMIPGGGPSTPGASTFDPTDPSVPSTPGTTTFDPAGPNVPGAVVDIGTAITPEVCQAQGMPGEVAYRVVVDTPGSYRTEIFDWVENYWAVIRDGADWLEDGNPILVSSVVQANEVGVEAIEDLFGSCVSEPLPGVTFTPAPTTPPPTTVPGIQTVPPSGLPPIDWDDVESGQNGGYPEPGTVVQVVKGDRLLGTYSPLNPGSDAQGEAVRSLVYMTLLSAGALAAIKVVGDPDEPGVSPQELFSRKEIVQGFARKVATNEANRIDYLQLIQCSPLNDAIYGTYGYGPLAFPAPTGRAVRMLPYHYNNRARLAAGKSWKRNIRLGTPADRETGNATGAKASERNYPLLYLPAINLDLLWSSSSFVVTTEGVTWSDGSNGIMPPPELMARGVDDVPEGMPFGCLGYEVEIV